MLTASELTSHIGRLMNNAWELVDDLRMGHLHRQDVWYVAWTVWKGQSRPHYQQANAEAAKATKVAPKELAARQEIIVERLPDVQEKPQVIEVEDKSEKQPEPITIADFTVAPPAPSAEFVENDATSPQEEPLSFLKEQAQEEIVETSVAQTEDKVDEKIDEPAPIEQQPVDILVSEQVIADWAAEMISTIEEKNQQFDDLSSALSTDLNADLSAVIDIPAMPALPFDFSAVTPRRPQAWVRQISLFASSH